MKISKKNIENWRNWKTQFFWVGHFEFFLLHPHENQSKVLGYQRWDKMLMITLISSQKSPTPNISAPSVRVNVQLFLLANARALKLFLYLLSSNFKFEWFVQYHAKVSLVLFWTIFFLVLTFWHVNFLGFWFFAIFVLSL